MVLSLLGPPVRFMGTPRARRSARQGRHRNVRHVAHCCPWRLSALRRDSPLRVPPRPNHRARRVSEDAPAGRPPAAASSVGRSHGPGESPGVRRCGRRVPRNQDRSCLGFPHRGVRRRTPPELRAPRSPERENLSLQQSCDSGTRRRSEHTGNGPCSLSAGSPCVRFGMFPRDQLHRHAVRFDSFQGGGCMAGARDSRTRSECRTMTRKPASRTRSTGQRRRSVRTYEVSQWNPTMWNTSRRSPPRVQPAPVAVVEPDPRMGALIVWKRQTNAGRLHT